MLSHFPRPGAGHTLTFQELRARPSGGFAATPASLAECALRQHEALLDRGALLHEILPQHEPIRLSPTEVPQEVVVTGRWLAEGVFTVAVALPQGQLLPALLDMPHALSFNPGLTPLGTVDPGEPPDWRAFLSGYLTPMRQTLHSAIVRAGNEAAVSLLEAFPGRVDLRPKGLVSPGDRPAISEIVQWQASRLVAEISSGLRLSSRLSGGCPQEEVQRAESSLAQWCVRGIEHQALSFFRDTRLQVAQFEFEHYRAEGPIGALVEELVRRTNPLASSLIAKEMFRQPLGPRQPSLLKPALKTSLREATASSPLFKELWACLPRSERASVLRCAARLAWSLGAQRYANSN